MARLFYDAGYRFAVRYVRRSVTHDFDVNTGEIVALIEAGLGVMLVQHVAAPGWRPNAGLGTRYGVTAAAEAQLVGLPKGVTLWCDLEGVSATSVPGDVIFFCNAWHAAVKTAGYEPGLYVGDSCGLSADQLYRNLRFSLYWAAYNLNADNVPAVRGVCMKQKPYPSRANRVIDAKFEYDEDIIMADRLGSSPTLFLPDIAP